MPAGVLRTVFLAAKEGGVAGPVHADLTAPLFVEGLDLLAQARRGSIRFLFLGFKEATESNKAEAFIIRQTSSIKLGIRRLFTRLDLGNPLL